MHVASHNWKLFKLILVVIVTTIIFYLSGNNSNFDLLNESNIFY